MSDTELRALAERVKAALLCYPDYDRTIDEDEAIRLADAVLARVPAPAETAEVTVTAEWLDAVGFETSENGLTRFIKINELTELCFWPLPVAWWLGDSGGDKVFLREEFSREQLRWLCAALGRPLAEPPPPPAPAETTDVKPHPMAWEVG